MLKKIIDFIKKINNKFKNNDSVRTAFIFGLVFFLFYFILGSIFTYNSLSTNKFNLFFGADTPRVIVDLTKVSANHYRTLVHPLFIILFQPIVQLLNLIIKNELLSSVLFQSMISGFSIVFLYLILDKFKLEKKLKYLFLLIFGFSFSNIVFNSTIETFPIAQLFLIILFYYALCKKNTKITNWDIALIVVLGVVNLGITITNYFVYLLVIIYLIGFNSRIKKSKKIFLLFIIVLLSVTLSVTLSELQAAFFPSSQLFFKDNLSNILIGQSEELNYIQGLSFLSITNQINSVLVHGFYAPKIDLVFDVENLILSFGDMYLFQKIFSLLTLFLILFMVVLFIENNYKKMSKHKYLILLTITFMFNFVLHIFYGNNESFLYTLHSQFMLILMIAYIIQDFVSKKNSTTIKNFITVFLILYLIVELIFNTIGIFKMYELISEMTGFIRYTSIYMYIIPIIAVIIIILLLKIKLKNKLIFIGLGLFLVIGYNVCYKHINQLDTEYNDSYKKYVNQISLLMKDFDVNVAYENMGDNFFFFGMGNRRKLMYQSGSLYDLDNNKVIASYDVKKEIIIPNEYMVIIETKKKEFIKIYENEESIFIESKNDISNLDEDACKLNLPEFKDHKYSEILKVLHHELLFNIQDSILKPNILVYSSGWYRDGMMGAMVLDITDNVNLIKDWVDNIEDIYDMQNGVKEADNLGELLYLIHITESKNPIKKEIIKEINNYIKGPTDGRILDYYPTVIAKYALELTDIDLELDLPKFDNYSNLTWYYSDDVKTNDFFDEIYFPYLGWAAYHTNRSGHLYICDSEYPLSYEREAAYGNYSLLPNSITYYKNLSLSPTHVWDAAEKFLFLIEQD